MVNDIEIFTGTLEYLDVHFSFVFDKQCLRLIPPEGTGWDLYNKLFMDELKTGCYTPKQKATTIDEPYIIGHCNEDDSTIVFFTKQGSSIGYNNYILFIDLIAFIHFKSSTSSICRISFTGPEINCIHPVTNAYSTIWDAKENGKISIETNSFTETTTDSTTFDLDGKKISTHFGIGRSTSRNRNGSPLKLNSWLFFDFETTEDYSVVLQLCRIAKRFIQFLCYRENIIFSKIQLSKPYEEDKCQPAGELFFIEVSTQEESKPLEQKRLIRQELISGCEGAILNDIASNQIYLRHIPESFSSSHHYHAARFIMITAAFEWEFKRIYPKGLKKPSAKQKAAEKVDAILSELLLDDSNNNNVRSLLKYLKKQIDHTPLENKIKHTCSDMEDIVDIFSNHLYKLNDETVNYTKIGKRLADQRNDFAHGNLDKDFNALALLDLLFLEMLLYIMQLKYYQVPNHNIMKAINDLFHKNLLLPNPTPEVENEA